MEPHKTIFQAEPAFRLSICSGHKLSAIMEYSFQKAQVYTKEEFWCL